MSTDQEQVDEARMPIYEYECQECGARFDKLVFLTARPRPVNCPECASAEVSKQWSLIASSAASSDEGSGSSAACTTST